MIPRYQRALRDEQVRAALRFIDALDALLEIRGGTTREGLDLLKRVFKGRSE
jgi:hypothetical protein